MRLGNYSRAPGYSTQHSLKTWPKTQSLATLWHTCTENSTATHIDNELAAA
jgi:hypothetical protein